MGCGSSSQKALVLASSKPDINDTTGELKSVKMFSTSQLPPTNEMSSEPADNKVDSSGNDTSEKVKEKADVEAPEKKKKELKPMTEEELKEFKEKTYEYLQQTADDIMALEYQIDDEGYCHVKIRNGLLRFMQSYFALKQVDNLEDISKYRLGVADILVNKKFLGVCCDCLIKTYPGGIKKEDGKSDEKKYFPIQNSLLTLLNYSDACESVAVGITNHPGFLEMVKEVLESSCSRHIIAEDDTETKKLSVGEGKIMKWCLSITHNCSMCESNISRLRELDFTKVLVPYLQSPNELHRITSLASLAGIVNEEECEIINNNQSEVKRLLVMLEKGLKQTLRRHNGWSCKEIGLTVRQLARNDANKKLLFDLGAIELLVELGQTGNEEEQYESVSAIWTLCFDNDIRKKVCADNDLGVIELLTQLKGSGNKKIKHACEGALWTLKKEQRSAEGSAESLDGSVIKTVKISRKNKKGQQSEPGIDLDSRGGVEELDTGHIFISYQWSDQETLKKIRDKIKERGFKVWMDIDQMGGSTLQAMAEAVENAHIVLLCMSQKYKNSSNCRAEAEYAFQKTKKIIPLKMERGYQPDGWLGFICGAKLYFEFSWKYPFEDKCAALVREIEMITGQNAGTNAVEPEIKPTHATTVESRPSPRAVDYPDSSSAPMSTVTKVSVSMATVKTVRNWNNSDVKTWIEKNDLKGCLPDTITGGEIALLISMRVEAPDFFYKTLQDLLKVQSLLTMSKIVWALQDIERA